MDLQTSKDILPTCYKFKLQKVYYGMNMNQDQKINRSLIHLSILDFKCITFISLKYLFVIKMCRQKYNYKNLSSLKYRKNSF